MVRRESPRVMAATLVLVFLSMLVLLGSLWQALAAMLPAVVTVVGAVCLLPVVGLQLNTLNIIVIPVLLGVGVDGGVHMVAQFATGLGLQQVLTQVGPAIMGALMTTGLGFGSLLIADHSGLNSVGWVAIVGLGVNLFACLVLLPSWITVGRKLYHRVLQGLIHD
jgi:predicted RND superfamily exporter protein